MGNQKIQKLKQILSELPEIRWNISETEVTEHGVSYLYFGDEWDNWEHLEENERAEYFSKIFSCLKRLKDVIEEL